MKKGTWHVEGMIFYENDPHLQISMTREFMMDVLYTNLSTGTKVRMEMNVLCEHTNTEVKISTEEYIIDNKNCVPEIMNEMSLKLANSIAIALKDWLPPESERSDFEGDGSVIGSKIVGHRLVIIW